jgi:hypothetical protein|tara:strand:+ start:80 stop:235 length:156 start_codon:yes stop_codon:yes gene_type:complete
MDIDNLKLKRTDSTIFTTYNNKLCIVMSPLKMLEKIKLIEDDLKLKLKKYK